MVEELTKKDRMVIEINSTKDNSGKGLQSLFSKQGLMQNTMYKCFDNKSNLGKPAQEE